MSPIVLTTDRFFVYFGSHCGPEPPHVHLRTERRNYRISAKFWLVEEEWYQGTQLARSNLPPRMDARAERVVAEYFGFLVGKWHEFFG